MSSAAPIVDRHQSSSIGRRLADVDDAELDRRVGVVEREGHELAVAVEDHGEVAGGRFVTDRRDGLLEHPRVPRPDVTQRVGRHADREALVVRSRDAQQPLVQGRDGSRVERRDDADVGTDLAAVHGGPGRRGAVGPRRSSIVIQARLPR
jgi:hypothetical protein